MEDEGRYGSQLEVGTGEISDFFLKSALLLSLLCFHYGEIVSIRA